MGIFSSNAFLQESVSKKASFMWPRRIILHFDINKTIIISDAAAGVSEDQMMNSILTECVLGEFDESKDINLRTENDWSLLSSEPNFEPPKTGASVVTFGEFLENHTNMQKKDRKRIKTAFTNDGALGSTLRSPD